MKTLKLQKKPTSILFVLLISLLIPMTNSCSKEEPILNETHIDTLEDDNEAVTEEASSTEDNATEDSSSCSNPIDFVFNEMDGLVAVEFEEAKFTGDWRMKSNGNNFSGEGYMIWEGPQQLHEPGTGTATFKIKITNSGTYQFVWNSAVKIGTNGTDHNDTWLRFADAKDFYAKKGTSVVYPKDSGKTPNPEGASKDGWFKIFRSGSDLDFKWNALTYDNNGHEVFVDFDSPGTYLMEVSARSSGHGIDKFVLFNESLTIEEATSDSRLSAITCD